MEYRENSQRSNKRCPRSFLIDTPPGDSKVFSFYKGSCITANGPMKVLDVMNSVREVVRHESYVRWSSTSERDRLLSWFRITALQPLCAAVFMSGCGDKGETHATMLTKLAAAQEELSQKRGAAIVTTWKNEDMEAKTKASTLKLQTLQDRLETIKKEELALDAKITDLKNQEAFIFQRAGALLDAQNHPGALIAYQEFVTKFPASGRVSTANAIISDLEKILADAKPK